MEAKARRERKAKEREREKGRRKRGDDISVPSLTIFFSSGHSKVFPL